MQINYPVLLITDVHTNLFNLRRLLLQYPNHTVVCLGDIVDLWNKNKTNANQEILNFFIEKKIINIKGNHDEYVGCCPTLYNITDPMLQYLNTLPNSITLEFPDNKKYTCYHYRPNDIWGLEDPKKCSYEQFCEIYGNDELNKNIEAILIGHLHASIEINYENCHRKLIVIGPLKYGKYAILTETGLEHKTL